MPFNRVQDTTIGYYVPEMMYLSMVPPGGKRGPHLHRYQTDYFIFAFAGLFDIYLWESGNPDFHVKFSFGEHAPHILIVPPGIVHAYHNIAAVSGIVINMPDQLYKGFNKEEIEDIIRYEDNPEPLYKF